MIKYLIDRPIAVFMLFTAFFILGIITYINLPVSLLPDIPIPEISVHITAKNYSARELENMAVAPIRQQLLQVGKLTDIHSETRDGMGVIRLQFEYGANSGLAFIEVNEKIDAAMGVLPKEIDRPRVVKASATDIPIFNLNITFKQEAESDNNFIDLCEFAETVIRRRIEQLPQISMVDISGVVHKQILITPNVNRMKIAGITFSDIESALTENNIEPGNMVVREGHYEYSIKFLSVMRTIHDIQQVYIRKNDKIYQLKELAEINLVPEKQTGMVYYNGKQAVSLAVIKQSDHNIDDLNRELKSTINWLENDYPSIEFNISQNQTEILASTLSNLQQNLILAFLFICLVSSVFMRDIKSPLIIGLSILVSLIITLLFFYLCNISLNIISLTGLILASGMMIDNSIIVTDNIGQYRKQGKTLRDACITGTNEVIAPMLSSSLTTISVFVPLIFLSGIAGALFFDQAFSITVGLLVSYITGIILLPVLYKLIYSFNTFDKLLKRIRLIDYINSTRKETSLHEKYYHKGIDWIFSHKTFIFIALLAIFPFCILLFMVIRKDKMPEITQNEIILKIDWNENIHVDENKERILTLNGEIENHITESIALMGTQQYLLNRKHSQSSSESEVYFKVQNQKDILDFQEEVNSYFKSYYPKAIISFCPSNTIYEQIFITGEADLIAEYYPRSKELLFDRKTIKDIETNIIASTKEHPISLSFNQQLNLKFDKKKMILYNASYHDIYQAIKTGFKENSFTTLRSYEQYLSVVLGEDEINFSDFLNTTMIATTIDADGRKNGLTLNNFVETFVSEDVKSIIAGKNGEYIPFYFYDIDKPEGVIKAIKESSDFSQWDISFSGAFFQIQK